MKVFERWLVESEEGVRAGLRLMTFLSTLVLAFAALELFEAGTQSVHYLKGIWFIQVPVAFLVVFFAASLAIELIMYFDDWMIAESSWQAAWLWLCRVEVLYQAMVIATTIALSARSALFVPLLASTLVSALLAVFWWFTSAFGEQVRQSNAQTA